MIRRQVTLPVDTDRLWTALTDPDESARWLGGRMEWDLEEGGALRYVEQEGPERQGRVEVVRPGRYLRFRWWPTPDRPDDASTDQPSEVSYLLEEDADGTRLTISERAVPVAGPGWSGPEASSSASASASIVGSMDADSWTGWDGRLAALWAGSASYAIIA